jgi:protein O-mannosyl-transferase
MYDRIVNPTRPLQHRAWIAAAALLVTLAILPYLQTLGHDFVNYDDNFYVTENPHVQQGLTLHGIVWAFTTAKGGNWHPLTWLSHMLDISLWGSKPAGHHFTNVILHAGNALLLFLIFSRMTGALWRSAFLAALFAVHPLHVESVAWVAERKDVLSTFFGLLTLSFYLQYARDSTARRYVLVIALFVLALMAKPMLVSLPCIFLLLDIWPLRRWKLWRIEDPTGPALEAKRAHRILLEKVPLLVIAAIFSAAAFIAQSVSQNIPDVAALPLSSRIANALVGYVLYLEKLIAPIKLAVFYPYPSHWRPSVVAVSGLLLLLITAVAMLYRRQCPWVLIGWMWFTVTLLPVIGLIQVGWQSIADRYTYIPSIGIFIMGVWSIPTTLKSVARRASIAAACTVIGILTIMAWSQTSHWQNSHTLFTHAAQVVPGNFVAHQNLGNALETEKNLDSAFQLYLLAAKERPKFAKTKIHENIANVLLQWNRYEEALAELRYAIDMDPSSSTAFNSVGSIMLVTGKLDEAAKNFELSAKFDPDNMAAQINCGIALVKLERWNEAIAHLAPVARIAPRRIVARTYFARALAGRHDFDQAITELHQILQIEPGCAPAREALQKIESEKQQSQPSPNPDPFQN